MYFKKNIKDFAKIGDVHNINTRNKSKLIALVTRLHRDLIFYETMCTLFQQDPRKRPRMVNHNLKEL